MTDELIREPDEIRRDCARKLRSVGTPGIFTAFLGYSVGEDWATPKIEKLEMLPDRLLVRVEGDVAPKSIAGVPDDMVRLVHEVGEMADLDGDEVRYLLGEVAEIKGMTS